MTEAELNQEAEALLEAFDSLPSVQKYRQLKKAVENDSHLQQIQSQLKTLKATLPHLPYEKKQEVIAACKVLNEEYDSSPLVINYLFYKEEILKLIEPLTEAKL